MPRYIETVEGGLIEVLEPEPGETAEEFAARVQEARDEGVLEEPTSGSV